MDPTLGPESDGIGVGLARGRHAPGATADLTDDADLAWDRFVPDEEEEDDEEDDEFVDRLDDLELEDTESVAEDLELRWDVFEADTGDAEDDAKSARVDAVLERMAERAMRHAEGEDLDGPVLDDTVLDGAVLDAAVLEDGHLDDADLNDAVLGSGLVMLNGAAEAGASGLAGEDQHIDAVFARLEEAMSGDGEGGPRLVERLDNPYAWLVEEDADADAELDEALRNEAESGSIHTEFEEPEAWLEDEDVDEIGAEIDHKADEEAEVEDEFEDEVEDEVEREDEVEDEFEDEVEDEVEREGDSHAYVEGELPAPVTVLHEWEDDRNNDRPDVDDELADAPVVGLRDETDAPLAAVAASVATAWPEVDEVSAPASWPVPVVADDLEDGHEVGPDGHPDGELDGDLEADRREATPKDQRVRRSRTEGSDTRRLVLLALFFFVVVLGAVVLHFGHIRSDGSTPVTAATPAGSSPAQVERLESAIADVQSASSGAQAGLTTLTAFPTPPRVATIINPYVDSLHLYDTLAGAVTVPAPARQAAQTAETQVRSDIAFLRTVNGLPPIQLGAFITSFFARSTQLQQTMDTLQHALDPSGP